MSKGKRTFKHPDELGIKEDSRQYDDQIHRLITNKQMKDPNVI